MGRYLLIAVLFATACKDKKSEGLPPADKWSESPGAVPPVQQQGSPNNPHANLGGGNNPHAGVDMTNPHAGMDMNNPHAGVPGAPDMPDVNSMGLSSPDPNRKIDPSHRIAGVIKVHPKAKDRAVPGNAVFITVKKAGPDGSAVGPPLAVDRLEWTGTDLKFEMTEAKAMIAGTELSGDVVVTVYYDTDGEARSHTAGDIKGEARVKVPADNITVLLDDVL